MEGDMKEVVLARLERRLKDKDEEIHALKERIIQADAADQSTVKAILERLDKLEVEVHETQITLSEVMKKVGALEATLDSMLMSMNTVDEEPSEMPTDMSLPGAPQIGNLDLDFAAALPDQKDIKEDGHSKGDNKEHDVLRFFHKSNNS